MCLQEPGEYGSDYGPRDTSGDRLDVGPRRVPGEPRACVGVLVRLPEQLQGLGPEPVRRLASLQHAAHTIRQEDVFAQAPSHIDTNAGKPALPYVSRWLKGQARVGVRQLKGETNRRKIKQIHRIGNDEANEPRSRRAIDIRPLGEERTEFATGNVGRALGKLEVQPWNKLILLRGRDRFQTT